MLTLLALAGCATGGATSSPHGDPGSSLACTHFRNVMDDMGKGILTPAEVRAKAKQVYDDASIATQPVEDAATALLRAATQDDGSAFVQAATTMSQACGAVGD